MELLVILSIAWRGQKGPCNFPILKPTYGSKLLSLANGKAHNSMQMGPRNTSL